MITSLFDEKGCVQKHYRRQSTASYSYSHRISKQFGSLSGWFACFEPFVNYQKRKYVNT
jgi:hypothetical protein